jgi:hypothetical protein
VNAPSWKAQYSRSLRFHLRSFPTDVVDDYVDSIESHIDGSVDALLGERLLSQRRRQRNVDRPWWLATRARGLSSASA